MSEKKQKEIKPGEPLKQKTVMLLSITVGLCIFLIFVGLVWIPEQTGKILFIVAGVVILLVGVLCTLPNTLAWLRGKKRERLIKQGKLVEEKKKDFNPNNRWGD